MSDWISTFPGYSHLLKTVKKGLGRVLKTGPIPQHVGIIMDGNRRYAKNHKIEMKEGHNMGFESMANILEILYESGIKCATVYAFSIENFSRLKYEVEWLMNLVKLKLQQLCQLGELCEQYGIRINVIGNTKLLPLDIQKILAESQEITSKNTNVVLNVCFPYTSRDEMTMLIKRIVDLSTKKDVTIDEDLVTNNLYTKDSPPLDLLIRTSGTYRLSDFLLWQCVSPGCEIVFTNKLWPEFRPWDMYKILINWSFNKYWGNKKVISPQSYTAVESVKGSTGYQRYGEDYSDSEIEDDDSTEDSEIGNEAEHFHSKKA